MVWVDPNKPVPLDIQAGPWEPPVMRHPSYFWPPGSSSDPKGMDFLLGGLRWAQQKYLSWPMALDFSNLFLGLYTSIHLV